MIHEKDKRNMKKILLQFNHFAPYRDDIFDSLQQSGEYQLKFFIKSHSHNHDEWNYEIKNFDYVVSSSSWNFGKLGILYKEYPKMIKEYKPNCVITAGSPITLLYTKLFYRNIKVIYVSDQVQEGNFESRHRIIKFLLKTLYGLADGIWCPGNAGFRYFLNFVSQNKIRQGCYTNDCSRILASYHSFDRLKERVKIGISGYDYVFLFVGKLIPSRQIEKTLEIAKFYRTNNKKVKFLIVGDGPDAEKVKTASSEINSNICYIPRLSLKELEMAYAVSDAYLFMGWEPYSLALYEACIVGLPVVANGKIGATYDCVESGKNGERIFSDNIEDFIVACDKAIQGKYDEGARKMKEFIINNRGIKWAANQLMELIEWT